MHEFSWVLFRATSVSEEFQCFSMRSDILVISDMSLEEKLLTAQKRPYHSSTHLPSRSPRYCMSPLLTFRIPRHSTQTSRALLRYPPENTPTRETSPANVYCGLFKEWARSTCLWSLLTPYNTLTLAHRLGNIQGRSTKSVFEQLFSGNWLF